MWRVMRLAWPQDQMRLEAGQRGQRSVDWERRIGLHLGGGLVAEIVLT